MIVGSGRTSKHFFSCREKSNPTDEMTKQGIALEEEEIHVSIEMQFKVMHLRTNFRTLFAIFPPPSFLLLNGNLVPML